MQYALMKTVFNSVFLFWYFARLEEHYNSPNKKQSFQSQPLTTQHNFEVIFDDCSGFSPIAMQENRFFFSLSDLETNKNLVLSWLQS